MFKAGKTEEGVDGKGRCPLFYMENKIRILDFSRVATGIRLCLDNAKALLEEAIILHNNKKYRGSSVFSLFASEELAKIEQIFNLSEPVNKNEVQKKWKEFIKKFCSHEKKLISSFTNKIIADIEETGGEKVEKIITGKVFSKNSLDLISLKEACLYVNCDFNNKKFITPYEISEDISKGLIEDVKEHLKRYKQFDKVTVKDIEKALEEYTGDEYWEKRPFEADTKRIKDKLEEIENRTKQR